MSQSDIITGEAPKRYAMAVIELASNATVLKSLEKDLVKVKTMFASSVDLRRLASSPVIATEDKVKAMVAVAKKAKLGNLATQFIGLVATNRRTAELPAIITAVEGELALRRGSQIAKVTSAKKLTAAQVTAIKTNLKKTVGRKVDLELDVDSSLLGGFVVRLGSKLYDSSLKTQLEDLNLALKDA
ncbi:MAG: F0F1 ATP synthase subunit delta [Maricaulaceae bacterium]